MNLKSWEHHTVCTFVVVSRTAGNVYLVSCAINPKNDHHLLVLKHCGCSLYWSVTKLGEHGTYTNEVLSIYHISPFIHIGTILIGYIGFPSALQMIFSTPRVKSLRY